MPGRQIKAQIALGKILFFDTALSADGKTRCASCHEPAHLYTDTRKTSQGAFQRLGTRNTPSLLLVTRAHQPLFWDGRRQDLAQAVLDPLLHPAEMAIADRAELSRRLQSGTYPQAFDDAFGEAHGGPTPEEAGQALAALILALPKPPTPFDRYLATHDTKTLSIDAREGMRLFEGKAGCSQCHRVDGASAPFTDEAFHATGTGLQAEAAALPELARRAAAIRSDPAVVGVDVGTHPDDSALGRFMVTHHPADLGLFRTPSLRYVANTAPYMHDGSVATLEAAVDQEIYWRGLTTRKPLSLTVHERATLIAFLRALSLPPNGTAP